MNWRDLFTVFKSAASLEAAGQDFATMLDLCERMYREVNGALWQGKLPETLLRETYERDIQLNQLERGVRKRVLIHLSMQGSGAANLSYCMVLLNVVKDAERIGDYVKNLAEIPEISGPTFPEGEVRTELRDIGQEATELLEPVGHIFRESNAENAEELIRHGRSLSQRADAVLPQIARSDYGPAGAVTAALLARTYKRIIGHNVNILSSVVMPVHKIDYFDEDELEPAAMR